MTAALKSLSFTILQKPSSNPVLDRRARVIARLEEQKLLLADSAYRRTVRSWSKDGAGNKALVETKQRVLPWWATQPNGSYAFFIRSGWKAIANVCVGEEVMSMNQTDRSAQWRTVTKTHKVRCRTFVILRELKKKSAH